MAPVSELTPPGDKCSQNLSHPLALWIISHAHAWVSDGLFTSAVGEKPKWLGLPSKTIYFCCLQCPDLMQFKKFLTMHESESKELEGRLSWHKLIIWSTRMRRHLWLAMPTALNLMSLLLQKWRIPIITGHKPLGIIGWVSVEAWKSEVTLEWLSRLDLMHTVIKPPPGPRFARPFMTARGVVPCVDISWWEQRQEQRSVTSVEE